MNFDGQNFQILGAWLQVLVPLLYGAAALVIARMPHLKTMWPAAVHISGVALAAALAGTVLRSPLAAGPMNEAAGVAGTRPFLLDDLTSTMLLLVAFIALVIMRYARSYLWGDASQPRFIRWFFATVASVSLLVVCNHLMVLMAAWIGTSVCLHQLLTFYGERPQAQLAAHKKFLLSRLADVMLISGFILVGQNYGTFRLDEIFASITAQNGILPASVQTATILVAFAMVLKCAQLPFHGWLIQVMEAPTPVSALLHAGVVNIGGFLLIRLAPLIAPSPGAQWLLVIAGSFSAIVAGLVMMTRISVKVMLAWSTCAQMGFMLMECGLGAYSLALLHLLAHSLYKAYSFMGSGHAVEHAMLRGMLPKNSVHGISAWVAALLFGSGAVGLAGYLIGPDPAKEPAIWALAGVLAIGISTLAGEALARREAAATTSMLAWGFAIGLLYFGWHALFVYGFDLPIAMAEPMRGAVAWVVAVFLVQYAIYAATRISPDHPALKRLHVFLYHGLYLDEIFTRLAFLIWPPNLQREPMRKIAPLKPLQNIGEPA